MRKKSPRVRLQTTIDEKILNKLRHMAVDKGMKLNDLLEDIISLYFESIKDSGKK